ncbi:MAG TPA: hydroxysqualene dehydroxylase HpnE [Candidatus Acidoferrum sp.]|nr:hydroxysqualene dehydroxylase HpnE [Candidatus Acidoferrum sp.]
MIVIGGGLAGLSAGIALSEAGCRVRLFEQRPFLGGRATSYCLPDGEHVDNCQHVTFACCTNLEDFYRRVGVAEKIKFFDRLLLQDPQGRRGSLKAGILPAPLHLMGSFLTFRPLSAKDKLSIGQGMLAIFRSKGEPEELKSGAPVSMTEWLKSKGQTAKAIERFWRVVLVSALSEELDRIDARYGIQVFWKSVLATRKGYRMGVPVVELGALYEHCRTAIERKGGEVNLRVPLRGLRFAGNRLKSVVFDEGREEVADAVVLALPHGTLDELLPEEVKRDNPELAQIGRIEDAPITGVHLWFDREVMSEPHLTLLETTTQWIFNKSMLSGNRNGAGKGPGQYLQLVISASYDLLEKPRQEIIDLCLAEVRQALPLAGRANLLKATVIKEARATFSPQPGVDRWRPTQQTSVKGMVLAGDWTATGWPATMEGAVRSGYLAAEAVLRVAGTPREFLKPDLPPDGLAGILS